MRLGAVHKHVISGASTALWGDEARFEGAALVKNTLKATNTPVKRIHPRALGMCLRYVEDSEWEKTRLCCLFPITMHTYIWKICMNMKLWNQLKREKPKWHRPSNAPLSLNIINYTSLWNVGYWTVQTNLGMDTDVLVEPPPTYDFSSVLQKKRKKKSEDALSQHTQPCAEPSERMPGF